MLRHIYSLRLDGKTTIGELPGTLYTQCQAIRTQVWVAQCF